MNKLIQRSGLFDELFRDVAPGFYVRPLHGDGLPQAQKIRLDVKEKDDAYVVDAEIPGVDKEDIQVSIDGAVVSLRAEIKQHDEQKDGDKVLRSERFYGAIERNFQLPLEVDAEKSSARYENGILMLQLPKKQNSQAQRLKIS